MQSRYEIATVNINAIDETGRLVRHTVSMEQAQVFAREICVNKKSGWEAMQIAMRGTTQGHSSKEVTV